jgi:NTE family protein
MPDTSRTAPLAAVPLLAGLEGDLLERLAAQTRSLGVKAGEWLFREGDPADAAYVIAMGRLEVVDEGPPETIIRTLKRGDVLGELALLQEGRRSASVRAVRDTWLVVLGRGDFEALMRNSPDFALDLTRNIGGQLAASRSSAPDPSPPDVIAVVGIHDAAWAPEIADTLERELARYGSVARLGYDTDRAVHDFPLALDRAEHAHDRVLLVGAATAPGEPWTDFCLREADAIVAVTHGAPALGWLEQRSALKGCELLATAGEVTEGVIEALQPREVQVVPGGVAGLEHALEATARRIAGRSVGLVLSGGGARAFAHLGVLDELDAAGIVVDRYAGASMGSIVAGISAMGASTDELHDIFVRCFVEQNPSRDYTLPAYGLIRGARTRKLLAEVFGARTIEELPHRFFCVACDLFARELVVFRTGPAAQAVYASLAIPGVYPPVASRDGRLLVDGGVMDNLPVEAMAAAAEGPVIAVDVSHRGGAVAPPVRPRLEPLRRPLRRLLTGSEEPLPRVGETLLRTMALGSIDTAGAGRRHADLVISPQIEGVRMLEWQKLDQTRAMGREAAKAALDQAGELIASWSPR